MEEALHLFRNNQQQSSTSRHSHTASTHSGNSDDGSSTISSTASYDSRGGTRNPRPHSTSSPHSTSLIRQCSLASGDLNLMERHASREHLSKAGSSTSSQSSTEDPSGSSGVSVGRVVDKDTSHGTGVGVGEIGGSGNGRNRVRRFCRIILPDGSTTVVQTNTDNTVGSVVERLCDKRGLLAVSLDLYLVSGSPSSLSPSSVPLEPSQPSSVLSSREVVVERLTLFILYIPLPTPRWFGVRARGSRPVRDVLQPILTTHGINLQSVAITVLPHHSPINLPSPISVLDGCKVMVDVRDSNKHLPSHSSVEQHPLVKKSVIEIFKQLSLQLFDTMGTALLLTAAATTATHSQSCEGSSTDNTKSSDVNVRHQSSLNELDESHHSTSQMTPTTSTSRSRDKSQPAPPQRLRLEENYELFDLLTRAQAHRMDDQRGCAPPRLEIPAFLRTTTSTTSSSTTSSSSATKTTIDKPKRFGQHLHHHSVEQQRHLTAHPPPRHSCSEGTDIDDVYDNAAPSSSVRAMTRTQEYLRRCGTEMTSHVTTSTSNKYSNHQPTVRNSPKRCQSSPWRVTPPVSTGINRILSGNEPSPLTMQQYTSSPYTHTTSIVLDQGQIVPGREVSHTPVGGSTVHVITSASSSSSLPSPSTQTSKSGRTVMMSGCDEEEEYDEDKIVTLV